LPAIAEATDIPLIRLNGRIPPPRQQWRMAEDVLTYPIDDRLYLNLCDRCTLSCAFCPKHQGTRQLHQFDLTLSRRPSPADLIAAIGDPTAYQEIVFCGYGEPTLRLGPLLEIAHWIKRQGGRVRLNTDGLANLVHKRDVVPDLAECVDAVSVSMNAQNAEIYARHCRPALPGSYAAMLEFLERSAARIGEVTATAIDGLPGVDIEACRRMARSRGAGFRRRVLDVVG
jgi:TatD family-associated radical SAM protein